MDNKKKTVELYSFFFFEKQVELYSKGYNMTYSFH